MKKMSFLNIKDVLNRDEMKSIMAGSGSTCSNCIASNGPACTAAGHTYGTGGYDTCVITLRTACENQSYCQ